MVRESPKGTQPWGYRNSGQREPQQNTATRLKGQWIRESWHVSFLFSTSFFSFCIWQPWISIGSIIDNPSVIFHFRYPRCVVLMFWVLFPVLRSRSYFGRLRAFKIPLASGSVFISVIIMSLESLNKSPWKKYNEERLLGFRQKNTGSTSLLAPFSWFSLHISPMILDSWVRGSVVQGFGAGLFWEGLRLLVKENIFFDNWLLIV